MSHEDFDELLKEVKGVQHYDLLEKVGTNHMYQSCFDKSDYRPLVPLTCSFYVTKYE